MAMSGSTFGQAYKWVDEEGQTHFSQTPSAHYNTEIIKIHSGPKVEPVQSQQAVEALIEQQTSDAKLRQEDKLKQQQQAEKAGAQLKNCDIAESSLKQYQNNPNGRTRCADGEYIRIDENVRQAKMDQLKQDIKKYCS